MSSEDPYLIRALLALQEGNAGEAVRSIGRWEREANKDLAQLTSIHQIDERTPVVDLERLAATHLEILRRLFGAAWPLMTGV